MCQSPGVVRQLVGQQLGFASRCAMEESTGAGRFDMAPRSRSIRSAFCSEGAQLYVLDWRRCALKAEPLPKTL